MAGALLVVIVLLLLFGVTLWAGVDAAFQPRRSWQDAGVDKGVTTAILVFSCALGAAYYFAFVRPRLIRAQQL